MSTFDKEYRDNPENELIEVSASTADVASVLSVTDSVEGILSALELNQSEIAQQSQELQQETMTKLKNEATQGTISALTQAGVPAENFDFLEVNLPPGPEKRKLQAERGLRRNILSYFSAFTEKIAGEAVELMDGSEEHDERVEKQLEAEIDAATTGAYGFVRMAGSVAEYFKSFLPGAKKSAEKSEADKKFGAEYKSIMLELSRRLSYIKKRLKYIGGGEIGSELKIAMSFTTLIPFALLGELRPKFDLAHKTLWWLKRTSRIYIEDRHGGIGEREPQDQALRSEASSFPLAAEIPQTDVASILTKKLERYAKNKEEYFLNDGKAHVLVWVKNSPAYIDVPLEWFAGPQAVPLTEAKQRIEALLKEAMENVTTAGLSPADLGWVRKKAYGNYGDQGKTMEKIFDADLAIVLDDVDVHDPKAVMDHKTFLTAGARVRETLIFQHESGTQDLLHGVNGMVNKFSHTRIDGKSARSLMIEDLQGTVELSQSTGESGLSEADLKVLVRGIDLDISEQITQESQSETTSAETISNREDYGVVQVGRARSEAWIKNIGALREWYKKLEPNNPVSFGTADLFCVAQMLASRTQNVHFLESRMAQLPVQLPDGTESQRDVEVLDVAFNVLPAEYLDIFSQIMSEIHRPSNFPPEQLMAEAWKRMALPPEKLAELRLNFIEGMRQFLEEKKRAKQSNSMASFMSTMAGGIKQVEKLMQFVSRSSISVGDIMTQAVSSPRGGMVSMLAETRSLPQKQENAVNMLWFGSANTDIYVGDSQENWGGVLGVSSNSEGFSFVLRKLLKQSQVSTEYYAQNKAFQEEAKGMMAKVPKVANLTLAELPFLIAEYEDSSDKSNFFGGGVRSELVYGFLVAREKYYTPKIQSTSEVDTQRQAEDVVFAMEFMLQLLSSDPALQTAV